MRPLAALAHRITGDRDCALDLAQETLITGWEKLDSFSDDGSFSSWLYKIASNKSLNHLRLSRRRKELEVQEFSGEPGSGSTLPDRDLVQSQLRDQVAGFISELPPQQRIVFELRFYKQMTFEEIAKATGKSLGTAKTHYRLAVQKLKAVAVGKGWDR